MPKFKVDFAELQKDPIIIEYIDKQGKTKELRVADLSAEEAAKYLTIFSDFKGESQTVEQAKLLFGLKSKEDAEWLKNQNYRMLHSAVNIGWQALNYDETVKKNLELASLLKL